MPGDHTDGTYGHACARQLLQRAHPQFWTNLFPTELVKNHAKDIKRFQTAIRWMRRLEVIFALIPIKISLKLWGLSDEFINYMILPS